MYFKTSTVVVLGGMNIGDLNIFIFLSYGLNALHRTLIGFSVSYLKTINTIILNNRELLKTIHTKQEKSSLNLKTIQYRISLEKGSRLH